CVLQGLAIAAIIRLLPPGAGVPLAFLASVVAVSACGALLAAVTDLPVASALSVGGVWAGLQLAIRIVMGGGASAWLPLVLLWVVGGAGAVGGAVLVRRRRPVTSAPQGP